MRKLKLQVQISVDGYVGGPKGEMDWLVRNWDAELIQYVTALTESFDCIVLGRKLAEGFIPHWAGIAADANHPEHAAGQKFTNTPKVVFTKSLAQVVWPQTILATGDLVAEIQALKQQPGGDIIAYGGATFVSALIKHGLIDEFHLFVNPTALGRGLAIFKELNGKQNLKLVQATPFSCGIVVLNYSLSNEEAR